MKIFTMSSKERNDIYIMNLEGMGALVSNVGFPIGITLIILYAIYKAFNSLMEKVLNPFLERFFKGMDDITASNKTLVETNAKIAGDLSIKMTDMENKVDKIESKVDKIVDKLG